MKPTGKSVAAADAQDMRAALALLGVTEESEVQA